MLIANFLQQFVILYSSLSILVGCGIELNTYPEKLQLPLLITSPKLIQVDRNIKHIKKLVILLKDKKNDNWNFLSFQNQQNLDDQSSSNPPLKSSQSVYTESFLWTLSVQIVSLMIIANFIVIFIAVAILFWLRKSDNQNLNETLNKFIRSSNTLPPQQEDQSVSQVESQRETKLNTIVQVIFEIKSLIEQGKKIKTLEQPIDLETILSEQKLKLDKLLVDITVINTNFNQSLERIVSENVKVAVAENYSSLNKAYDLIKESLNQLNSKIEQLIKSSNSPQVSQETITQIVESIKNKLISDLQETKISQPGFDVQINEFKNQINELEKKINESTKDLLSNLEKTLKECLSEPDAENRDRHNNRIDRDINKILKEIGEIQEFQGRMCNSLEDILKKLKQRERNDSQEYLRSSNFSHPSSGQQNPGSNTYSPPNDLLKTYSYDPNSLEKISTKVSPTEESLLGRREDYQKPIFFESKTNGKYWVVSKEDHKGLIYWLFPTPSMAIDQYTSEIINFLFKGSLAHAKSIEQLQLKKPARVSKMKSKDEWQLEEPGELNQISS